jgi:hypothetical protein
MIELEAVIAALDTLVRELAAGEWGKAMRAIIMHGNDVSVGGAVQQCRRVK